MLRAHAAGLDVAVRVAPGASRAGIDGIVSDADGAELLKIRVTAPPADGKANAAVIALLAKEWRLPKTSLTIAAGASQRRKTITIQGDARVLETRIKDWLRQRIAA